MSAERMAPLLLELARATRARRFYPAAHPTVQSALKRSARAWRDALDRHGAVRVDLRPNGFALVDGTAIEALGCEELADMLHMRGVRQLTAEPGLDLRQLATLVDLLNGTPSPSLASLLSDHDVTHLSVVERRQEPESERNPGHDVSDATLELLRLISELEVCNEPAAYRMVARRMSAVLERLIESKNAVDAYRAALVYCRHASDAAGLPGELREEARNQLRALASSEDMLRFVIEKARAESPLASVQAVQVLTCAGSTAVPELLAEHGRLDPEARRRIVSVVIAMGDEAFPSIVEELDCNDSRRIRRAVTLLGDMQNPKGVEFLAELLHNPDPSVRRDAARSLLRIGSERAVLTLVEALSGEEQTALVAASCLGAARNRTALRALGQVVPEESGRPESVRVEAIRSLGRIGLEAAVGCLAGVLRSGGFFRRKDARVLRVAAAEALSRIGGEEAMAALRTASRRGDTAVRKACHQALDQLER